MKTFVEILSANFLAKEVSNKIKIGTYVFQRDMWHDNEYLEEIIQEKEKELIKMKERLAFVKDNYDADTYHSLASELRANRRKRLEEERRVSEFGKHVMKSINNQ